jgi:hypothetical protein
MQHRRRVRSYKLRAGRFVVQSCQSQCGPISTPEDDSVYGIRATGDEGTKCDGPTEKVPYAWRKSQATFRAPNGWVKSTLVPDGSRMDQSGLKRDKTNYTEDDDTLVGSGKAMGQEGEAL